ncbi:MAG: hypothetical protein AB8F94_06005 [Saprospiraceae bacterium]
MGLFDFFRKKKQHPKDKTQSTDSSKNTDLPEVKKDIQTQREGYLELGRICLNESNRVEFSDFIDNLKDYTDDDEYMTTLNYVIDSLYQKGNYFIISLDWKQEITSLIHGVNFTLKENFNQQIELPKQEDYGKKASVSFDNVFKDFDHAINKKGFQLSFIDTNSDEYIVVINKVEDLEKVKSAIQKIGYDCLNANSRKISG